MCRSRRWQKQEVGYMFFNMLLYQNYVQTQKCVLIQSWFRKITYNDTENAFSHFYYNVNTNLVPFMVELAGFFCSSVDIINRLEQVDTANSAHTCLSG